MTRGHPSQHITLRLLCTLVFPYKSVHEGELSFVMEMKYYSLLLCRCAAISRGDLLVPASRLSLVSYFSFPLNCPTAARLCCCATDVFSGVLLKQLNYR